MTTASVLSPLAAGDVSASIIMMAAVSALLPQAQRLWVEPQTDPITS